MHRGARRGAVGAALLAFVPRARNLSLCPVSATIRVPRPTSAVTVTAAPDVLKAARSAARILVDHKANDVVMLDLREVTDMADYFIVASGTSDTHVRATAHHVIDELKRGGAQVHSVEGLETGRWVLLDYVDFVVHVFHPTLRSFYQLERLWGDAPTVPVSA